MENVATEALSRINEPLLLFVLSFFAMAIVMLGVILKHNKSVSCTRLEADKARVDADLALAKALTGLQTVLDQKVVVSPKVDAKLDKSLENDQQIMNALIEINAKMNRS